MKTLVLFIAAQEWRLLWRQRIAAIMVLGAALLLFSAGLASVWRFADIHARHQQLQLTSDAQWQAQPDRHPHRVAHYGTFAFRPPSLLSFFDPGADRYSGNLLFLEAHRQNTANFSEARQSPLLMRFGEWSPALVMQQVLPLLIIFLGYATLAGERESGRLRLLLVQGASGRQLLFGKLLAHLGVLACVILPTVLLALLTVWQLGDARNFGDALGLLLIYGCWLLFWVLISVYVSSWLTRARDSLWLLLGIWMLMIVVAPRLIGGVATQLYPLPTRVELAARMSAEMAKIGDSHNPDDPHFARFREQVLRQYGVSRIDDLPINYKGLVMREGERISSELFAQLMQEVNASEQQQSHFVRQAGWAFPLLALRSVSMALAGSDRAHAQHFADSAEQFRYALIQSLNDLQARHVQYHDDANQRLTAQTWDQLPQYQWSAPARETVLAGQGLVLLTLPIWCLFLLLLCYRSGRRVERQA